MEVAVQERLGETLINAGFISADETRRMVVAHLQLNKRMADTTDRSVIHYGITREVSTITPYALPQQRAAPACHQAGIAVVGIPRPLPTINPAAMR